MDSESEVSLRHRNISQQKQSCYGSQIRLGPGMLVSIGSLYDLFECINVGLNSAEFRPLPNSPSFLNGNVVLSAKECTRCFVHPSEETYHALEDPPVTVSTLPPRDRSNSNDEPVHVRLSSLQLSVEVDTEKLSTALPGLRNGQSFGGNSRNKRKLVDYSSASTAHSHAPLEEGHSSYSDVSLNYDSSNEWMDETPDRQKVFEEFSATNIFSGCTSRVSDPISLSASSFISADSVASLRSSYEETLANSNWQTNGQQENGFRTKRFLDWTPIDVEDWINSLEDIALRKYASRFYDQDVSGVELGRITLGYLHNKLMILDRGHRKSILVEIQNVIRSSLVNGLSKTRSAIVPGCLV